MFILCYELVKRKYIYTRGKSLLGLLVTTFLPDYQPPLIFVQFNSNFLCMCSDSMACYFKINQTKIKGGCQSGRKVVTHNSKSDLPLERKLDLALP